MVNNDVNKKIAFSPGYEAHGVILFWMNHVVKSERLLQSTIHPILSLDKEFTDFISLFSSKKKNLRTAFRSLIDVGLILMVLWAILG